MHQGSIEALGILSDEVNEERRRFAAEAVRLQPVYEWLVNNDVAEWSTIVATYYAASLSAAQSTCDESLRDSETRNLVGASADTWESVCRELVLPDAIERTAGALADGEIRQTVLAELPEHLKSFAPIDTLVLGRMMVRDSRLLAAVTL